ncbi:MAG: S26 family signal peptidase [Hyphomonas sp.]|uniref:S26 family signal peptidase n=1 Tax=Hyphomonas sp. TaxID=87 RepID=UPI0034A096C0
MRLPILSTRAGLGVAGLAVAALGFAALISHGLVLYNPSASLEPGFYVRVGAQLERGAVVTIPVRAVGLAYVDEGHVKAAGDRFLKRIAARAGDRVCSEDGHILINDVRVAVVSERDSAGIALPQWSGCRSLENGEVFLLGDDVMSFDGRYWGVTSVADIEATWRKFP